MCALCGVLTDGPHWTESGTDAGRTGAAPAGRARYLERTHRLALLNRVLGAYGCTADDWAGAHYMVHKRSGGATEMATDLPRLWTAVEGLIGRAPDPLDPALVAALDGAPPEGRGARGRQVASKVRGPQAAPKVRGPRA